MLSSPSPSTFWRRNSVKYPGVTTPKAWGRGVIVVVATVPTLQGSSIEGYATQLFNTWRLGRADKTNGVLLLVAPNERKVRIEVGYGLEGRLTNEICALILQDDVLPHFRKGDFAGGVTQGVEGIIRVLEADKDEWQPLSPEQTTR